MIQVKEIEASTDYILNGVFENGEKKRFDIKPYLKNGVFRELQNENYFKLVKNRGYFVEWPNEQNLSADTLYLVSQK